jgi:Rrf2 family protein
VQTREIAASEGIPEQFLEQVLAALRRDGIVRSIRGAGGGYELARSPGSIKAGDVLRALSGKIASVPCLDDAQNVCDRTERCVVINLWQRVQQAVSDVVDGTTIQDLVDEKNAREQVSFLAMNI